MSQAPLIELSDVSKLFGPIRALNCIHLKLDAGVIGILGPNGSGKSTLLRLLSGQAKPDSGTVRVLGQEPLKSPGLMRALGMCPENDGFYEDLSVRDWVFTLARMSGLGAKDAGVASDKAIEAVGLTTKRNERLDSLSQGMRQRAKMAQAIAHDPKILLLDEPLRGADPIARNDLTELIRRLDDGSRCVLVSSHILHEIEAMTSRVVFLRYGRLRAQGDIFALRAMLVDRPHALELRVSEAREAGRIVMSLPTVRGVRLIDKHSLEVTASELADTAARIPALLRTEGIDLKSLRCPDADLESLYRYLMEGHR